MHDYHLFLCFSQQPRSQNETVVHLQNVNYFKSRFPVAQSQMKGHATLNEQMERNLMQHLMIDITMNMAFLTKCQPGL